MFGKMNGGCQRGMARPAIGVTCMVEGGIIPAQGGVMAVGTLARVMIGGSRGCVAGNAGVDGVVI